ncbi:hypothetical protein GHT06_003734 [Daphnia sinensis]|uniref:Uncharacterized protein n=1 Tax=Daphnia sinensis TaxID=1820382 RepID=A0AAD5KTA7_9CRUS|nr:hypothetical protein GHT06_003734 [Daphnia sinensis]
MELFHIAGSTGSFTIGAPATIPSIGTILVNTNGSFTFTPVANYNGTVPVITYTVSDGNGGTDTGDLAITVTSVNDVPVALDDVVTTPEDSPVSGNVLTNDTDADENTLTVSSFSIAGLTGPFTIGTPATIPSVGTIILNADGSFTFTPEANYNGTVPVITYTVSDGNGGTDTGDLTITVTAVNDVPVATDDVISSPEDSPVSGNVLTNDTDVEGNTLTVSGYSIAGSTGPFTIGTPATIPSIGTIVVNSDGSFTFTPESNYNDNVPVITYTVSDGNGGTDTGDLAITVTALNVAPVAVDDVVTTPEDSPVSGNVLTNDTDVEGNTLTVSGYSIVGITGPFTIGTPATIPSIGTIIVNADGNVLTNDTDVDGNTLTVSGYSIAGLTDSFTIGTPATIPTIGTIVVNGDGSFTFTPEANYNGTVPVITYMVSDGNGGTDTGDLVITVTAVNDAPVAVDDVVTTPEDSPVSGNVLTNDTDVEGNTLTVSGYSIAGLTGPFTIGAPATIPSIGTIILNADGTFTFTPVANYNGTVPVITYTVSDGNGGMDSGDLTITVTAVNDESVDTDGDGVTNEQELLDGTDPNDGCEYESGSQDLTKVSSSWNSLDCDDDGLTNDEELTGIDDPATPADPKGIKTDPRNPDSDGDGVMDGLDLCSIVSGLTTDGCPIQEYVNLGTINSIIKGNISENNELMSDAIYGSPVADSENPLGAELTMNSDGTYTFFARISGVYNFAVPACLPGQTSGCMMIPLQITVFEDLVGESPSVDLKITKYAIADSWYEGDIVEYVIQVENLGTLVAKKLLVKDILPEGLGFVSSTVDGVLDVPNSREITWKFDSLVAGSSIEILLKVKALSLKDVKEIRIVNIASVSSAEVDLTESDNTASADILVKSCLYRM